MSFSRLSVSAALVGALTMTAVALPALAQGQNPAVAARQGHMQVMNLNLGILGDMARGNIEYDAEVAQTAANNLVAMGTVSQRFYWPAGTDNESMEGTAALPALWAEGSTAGEIGMRYGPASEALAAAAGQGLEAMTAAVGPLGAVCGDCHQTYRARN